MKQLPARQVARHFFADDDLASTNIRSIGRVVREVFDATPLGILIGVLRAHRAGRRDSSGTRPRRRLK